ncbi:MAG TPA: hypothetical protein DIU00_18585 [Phycisphaerales bacterium]|nr:hypothetical protein [Phycisphaerales bacterium]
MQTFIDHNKSTFLWPCLRACKARTRAGHPCKNWTVRGRARCRMHGGLAFGPTTEEGKAAIGRTHFRHGKYTLKIAQRRLLLKAIKWWELKRGVTCPRSLIDYWWLKIQKMPYSRVVKERAALTDKYRRVKKMVDKQNDRKDV